MKGGSLTGSQLYSLFGFQYGHTRMLHYAEADPTKLEKHLESMKMFKDKLHTQFDFLISLHDLRFLSLDSRYYTDIFDKYTCAFLTFSNKNDIKDKLSNYEYLGEYNLDETNEIIDIMARNIRVIISYVGTYDQFGYTDWHNNARNMVRILTEEESIIDTNRKIQAGRAFACLKKLFVDIFKTYRKGSENFEIQEHSSYESLIGFAICKAIMNMTRNEHIRDAVMRDAEIEDSIIESGVDLFFLQRLTSIGHSQGAIYAYLYGKHGLETIVYNPAPFTGIKPRNAYIIREEDDIVSRFTEPNIHGIEIVRNSQKSNIRSVITRMKEIHKADVLDQPDYKDKFYGDESEKSLPQSLQLLQLLPSVPETTLEPPVIQPDLENLRARYISNYMVKYGEKEDTATAAAEKLNTKEKLNAAIAELRRGGRTCRRSLKYKKNSKKYKRVKRTRKHKRFI